MSTLQKRFTRKQAHQSKKENRSPTKESSSIFLDSIDQSCALYYLGLTYHFKAKEYLHSNGGILNEQIRSLLDKSIVYYK